MKIIEPGYEILKPDITNPSSILAVYRAIETAARTCYKSESLANAGCSAARMVARLVKNNHLAMLEHAYMTVRFTVDRGISHEIVRHRIASFAMESTRYCNYSKDRFDGEVTFIRPCFFREDTEQFKRWRESCEEAEAAYFDLLNMGCMPEQARDVLPMSVKTEIVMTANMREWRHFFELRALGLTGKPHPQMVQVALPLFCDCRDAMPELFGDLGGENE